MSLGEAAILSGIWLLIRLHHGWPWWAGLIGFTLTLLTVHLIGAWFNV